MAVIQQKLKPFTIPNFVIVESDPRPRQEGFQEAQKFTLGAVPKETLLVMCEEFKAAVLAKADAQAAK